MLKTSEDLDQKSPFLSRMLAIFKFDSRFLSEENSITILDIVDPDQEFFPHYQGILQNATFDY